MTDGSKKAHVKKGLKEILDRISNAKDGAEKELAKLKELFAGKTTSKSKLMKKRSKKENKRKTKTIAWKRLEKATRIFISKCFGSRKFEEAFPMGLKNKLNDRKNIHREGCHHAENEAEQN